MIFKFTLPSKQLFRTLYFLIVLGPVYMEASYPGNRAGSVAETNYFLRLYATFHPVYQDGI